MSVAVMLLNFGEPEHPSLDEVTPFLERIFQANAPLEHASGEAARRARSRELAAARAPVLLETYRAIAGSPLNAQSREQAALLEVELRARGVDAVCRTAFQFTAPAPADVLGEMIGSAEALVGLPIYPLCGPSTTVTALGSLEEAARAAGWDRGVLEIGGWHRHPDYSALHADQIAASCTGQGIDVRDPRSALLFSIHGTPVKYLEAGSRYDRYVEEICEAIARGLGVARYHMGYQNHTNRPIEWTKPDSEEVVRELDADRVVVVAPSFMHEQSETLAELDHDLRRAVEERGMGFHRVPIPHAHPRFIAVLADLVEARLGREPAGCALHLRRCVCRAGGAARCTNGLRGQSTVVLEG